MGSIKMGLIIDDSQSQFSISVAMKASFLEYKVGARLQRLVLCLSWDQQPKLFHVFELG